MNTSILDSIVHQAQQAGLKLSLRGADRLVVSPASKLTPELSEALRAHKWLLIAWLCATSEAFGPLPTVTPPEERDQLSNNPVNTVPNALPRAPSALGWRELSQAYYAHHFGCRACIAAGRGSTYGSRCESGLSLWKGYADACISTDKSTELQSVKRRRFA